MRVLIACEFSGVVREAFLAKGHDAYSCDLLPANIHKPIDPKRHIQGDVTKLLQQPWDLVIAHPPCTYLTNSGVTYLKNNPVRMMKLIEGCEFFCKCLNANSPRIAVENPIMHKYAIERINTLYSQTIQPYEFGHGETKRTCLWLKGLPLLKATNQVSGREQRSHKIHIRGIKQGLLRSITLQGIADAMAEQWG